MLFGQKDSATLSPLPLSLPPRAVMSAAGRPSSPPLRPCHRVLLAALPLLLLCLSILLQPVVGQSCSTYSKCNSCTTQSGCSPYHRHPRPASHCRSCRSELGAEDSRPHVISPSFFPPCSSCLFCSLSAWCGQEAFTTSGRCTDSGGCTFSEWEQWTPGTCYDDSFYDDIRLATGAIVGIVVGSLALCAIGAVIVACVVRRRRRQRMSQIAPPTVISLAAAPQPAQLQSPSMGQGQQGGQQQQPQEYAQQLQQPLQYPQQQQFPPQAYPHQSSYAPQQGYPHLPQPVYYAEGQPAPAQPQYVAYPQQPQQVYYAQPGGYPMGAQQPPAYGSQGGVAYPQQPVAYAQPAQPYEQPQAYVAYPQPAYTQ